MLAVKAVTFVCSSQTRERRLKSTEFANTRPGFELLQSHLVQLGVPAAHILIGLEATSRYGENLYRFLEVHGYQLCLLHPRQTHQFALQRGLRAKTDRIDATTIARVLLSGQARRGYVPTEVIATYRELVRVHSQLSDEAARYKNEIQALLSVLFPEFTQVFVDPCRSTAIALLKLYPSAQSMAAAGVEVIAAKLHELSPHHYGWHTAEQLVQLAQQSSGSSPFDSSALHGPQDFV